MMVKYTELGARGSDRTRSVPESVSESNNGQNFQSWSNTRSNTRSRSRSRAAPTAPGDLNWSNNGQILVIYRSSNGRVTVEYQFDTVQTRVKDWSNNMFKLVKTSLNVPNFCRRQAPVSTTLISRIETGQRLVNRVYGQTQLWSNDQRRSMASPLEDVVRIMSQTGQNLSR